MGAQHSGQGLVDSEQPGSGEGVVNSGQQDPSSLSASHSSLATLFPQPERLAVAGETVEVWPLRVRQLAPFAAAMAPVLEGYEQVRQGLSGHEPEPAWWAGLVCDYAPALIPALAVALDRPEPWIGELFLDDLTRVAVVVFRVNADFFVQRMMPMATTALAPYLPATPGQTPATGSSAPATMT